MGAAVDLNTVGRFEDVLNIAEAVEYLKSIGIKRISKQTLYNRINKGTGPARFKRCGHLYFRKVDLDAWKKQMTDKIDAFA